MDFWANSERVQFDHRAAADLVQWFRATADELEQQVSARTSLAGIAGQEWRGVFARQFDGRVKKCVADAHMLATSMRHAAAEVSRLAALAHQEQHRRDVAMAWYQHHENRNGLEKIEDWFFDGDRPPDLTPIQPSAVDVAPAWHVSGRA